MATNNPQGPNGPDDDKDKKHPELPEWLRTDDWLQITPPPPSKIITNQPDDPPPAGSPTLPGEDQATDMIELEEDENVYNVEVPPSTMLFSDPDDSVNLTDDLPIVGPMSGKLKSGQSSIKLRSTKAAKPATDPDMPPPDAIPPVGSGQPASDDEIDLGALPTVENPRAAGPATSGILRPANPATGVTPITPAAAEDAVGQPLDPTGPASGWLSSATKLPAAPAPTPPPVKQPTVPSMTSVAGTWAELDVPPASKLLPPTPAATPPEDTSDSWHPSSGNVGLPSLANIDLPPQAVEEGSDVFSRATRPGTGSGPVAYEPPKIAKPAAPTPPPEQGKLPPTPTPPALKLPSQPDAPAEVPPGSWHPSSGEVGLPSLANIDLPPGAGSSADVFSAATRPGRPADPPAAKLVTPKPPAAPPEGLEATVIGGMAPVARPKPVAPEPDWLEATNLGIVLPPTEKPTDPASGWLAGASNVAKPADPPALDLEPTTDFGQGSNADIDLPPPRTEEASDIFSTAREGIEKSALPRPSTDSELYSGAMPFDPRDFKNLSGTAGDSNLFADPPEPPKPKAQETGRVELAPPKPMFEGTVDLRLSQILPGSKSDAVNFALPPGSADDSAASGGIEVVDTGASADDQPARPYENPLADDVVPEPKFGSLGDDLGDHLEAELLRDEGKPDFNLYPSGQPSDSNLLGDRTFADDPPTRPAHSSSVNLTDPNAFSYDPADSGQPSSIFNKLDKSAQASGGQIDLDSIPLMGSSDEATNRMDAGGSAVLGGRLDDPGLEESVFDVKMPRPEGADSGMIDWSTDARVTDRLGQTSLEQTQRSDYADPESASAVPVVPKPRGSDAVRPRSRPELTPEELEDLEPKAKRSPWLFAALGLLAGAGLGAVTMYNAGGSSTGGGNGDAGGKVAALEKRATDLSKTAEQLDADYKKLVADTDGLKKKAADGATASAALKQAEDDKQKMAIELGAAKEKLTTEVAVAKKLGEQDAAKKFDTEKAKLTADAKKAAEERTKLLGDVKKAADENAALAKMVEAANKDVAAKGMELDRAKAAAEAVAAKLKAADATLDPVIDKLKAAKLIDDKADREKAVAALPEALKKANLITGEGESAKLAKELTEARDALKKQRDDAEKAIKTAEDKLATAKTAADKQLADAKVAAEKSRADLQAKVDGADKRTADEVKKAVADATKDAEAKVAKAQEMVAAQKQAADAEVQRERTARAADQKQFEARLSAMQEQFARDVESARRGFTPTNNDVLIRQAEQAVNSYDAGTAAYFAGRYADAEKLFAAAAKADLADARYWYFLGLSKYAQGKAKEADADFKTGAEWEGRAKPGRRVVATALERVQGPARLALEAARP
jgi:hypothetical protein